MNSANHVAGHGDVVRPERPRMWAAVVILGVIGVISGMAQGNALFTGNGHFVELFSWTVFGGVAGVAIGVAVGLTLDALAKRRS